MIKAYPKIFTIGTDYICDIFKEDVEITEKVDGSQFCFGKDLDGNFYMRSKGRQLYPELRDKLFDQAVSYAMSVQHLISDNRVYYCEHLYKPKHNCLAYGRIPKNGLYLFGVSDYFGSKLMDTEALMVEAEWLGIEPPHILYIGKISSASELHAMMDTPSVLGNVKIEGLVAKNYFRQFLLGGQPIPVMAGKSVSEEFKEVSKFWKQENTHVGRWETFKESYRTEARWQKAVQHLRENGTLLNDPKDIGGLIKEIQRDIAEEEMEAIKNFLWSEFGTEVLRYSVKGFPQWYKDRLAERSFE